MSGGPHDGHDLVLVMRSVTAEMPVTLTGDGDVDPLGDPVIVTREGPESVYCTNCKRTIRPGEDGLAEDWQEL